MGPLTRGSRMWLGIKWTPLPAGRWLIERCSRVMEAGLGCGQLGCSSAPYSVLDDCHVNTTSLSVFWIVKGAERDSASRIFWIGVRGAARGLPVPGDPGVSDRPSGEEEVKRADGLLPDSVPARPPFGDPPDDDLRRRGRSGDCGLPGVDGMLSEAGGDEWDRAGTR